MQARERKEPKSKDQGVTRPQGPKVKHQIKGRETL